LVGVQDLVLLQDVAVAEQLAAHLLAAEGLAAVAPDLLAQDAQRPAARGGLGELVAPRRGEAVGADVAVVVAEPPVVAADRAHALGPALDALGGGLGLDVV